MAMESSVKNLCEQNLIPAYVDGELDDAAQARVQEHLDQCLSCRTELRFHQQFVCELDAVLADKFEVAVPANFSQVVAARAVSDMRGVRTVAENKKALAFCLVLAVTGFALLGATTRHMAINLVRRLVGKILGVAEFSWSALYDSVASVAVISRVLSRKFIVETGNLGVLLVLLALAVLLLSRLLSSYHRTRAIE
jgi:predicted anti-sigma-YlaC factor YlaD